MTSLPSPISLNKPKLPWMVSAGAWCKMPDLPMDPSMTLQDWAVIAAQRPYPKDDNDRLIEAHNPIFQSPQRLLPELLAGTMSEGAKSDNLCVVLSGNRLLNGHGGDLPPAKCLSFVRAQEICIALLLAADAKPSESSFVEAAQGGNPRLLSRLLASRSLSSWSADEQMSLTGRICLHLAENTWGTVKTMIPQWVKWGCPIDQLSETTGFNALHRSVQNGNIIVVRELLNNGASVNARTVKEGFTPLHLVSDVTILDTLVQAGADVNAQAHASVSSNGMSDGSLPPQDPHRGQEDRIDTPLLQAMVRNKPLVVERLLHHGADPFPRADLFNPHSPRNHRALDMALWGHEEKGFPYALVETLNVMWNKAQQDDLRKTMTEIPQVLSKVPSRRRL